jgi:hypothetical protein
MKPEAKRLLVMRLLNALGVRAYYADQFRESLAAPGVDAELVSQLTVDEMINAVDLPQYAAAISDERLPALVTFYESTVGQWALENMPRIGATVAQASSDYVVRRLNELNDARTASVKPHASTQMVFNPNAKRK